MLKEPGEQPKEELVTKNEKPPFALEISPQKLVIPSDGLLEVTIKNVTEVTQNMKLFFDSFFFLADFKTADWSNSFSTNSSNASCTKALEPGGTFSLTIGAYDKPPYPQPENQSKDPNIDGDALAEKMKSSAWNQYYNYEKPEGFLKIKHRRDDKSEWAVREEPLLPENDSPKYQEAREKFQKIKKDQERRARWGHTLVNKEDCTVMEYKKEQDIGWYMENSSLIQTERALAVQRLEEEMNKNILSDLEKIDNMTDEDIQKMRLTRRRAMMEKQVEEDKKKCKEVDGECKTALEKTSEKSKKKVNTEEAEPRALKETRAQLQKKYPEGTPWKKKADDEKEDDDNSENSKNDKNKTKKKPKFVIIHVDMPEEPNQTPEKKPVETKKLPSAKIPEKPKVSESPKIPETPKKPKTSEVAKPKTPEPTENLISEKVEPKKSKKNPCCSIL